MGTAIAAKTFLVTGSTEGIGLQTAKQLLRGGHTVLVHGRSKEKVDGIVKSLEASSGRVKGYAADLSSFAQIREMATTIQQEFPVLHGLLVRDWLR